MLFINVNTKHKTDYYLGKRLFLMINKQNIQMRTDKQHSGLKIGDRLPAFTLLNQHDEIISSARLAKQALVLFFYPKDDTPICIAEACSFRNYYSEFLDLDAQVIGISSDSRASHAAFAQKYQLPFTLLSDERDEVRKKFGVPAPFMGMAPGRVTYIFDESGKLVHKFNSFFQAKAHVEAALKQLKQLSKKK